MPVYTCEKCARRFLQKSGYTDHMNKKIDCVNKSVIGQVIEKKIEEKVKEVLNNTLSNKKSLILPSDPIKRDAVLQDYFKKLHDILWDKAGFNPEKAMEHLIFFFAYRLIEKQADSLSLPQECRWSFLSSKKNENDRFEVMKKGCISFQKNVITKPFFKKPEIDKVDIVFDIIEHINMIPDEAIDDTDTLGNIFEYMQSWGWATMGQNGQYFTNRIICRLAFKLAYGIKKTLRRKDGSLCTFADWFCGTGGFPAEYVKGVNSVLKDIDWEKEKASICCQDQGVSNIANTLLNLLIMTGRPFTERIKQGNSFTDNITIGSSAPFKDYSIDYSFMNPPYAGSAFEYSKTFKLPDGSKSKKFLVNKEIQSIGIDDNVKVSAGTQLAMATLSENGGICCIVLSQGFFFGASKKCIELRKKIAEEYKIWYVVDITSGSFINTGTKTSMMVFQRGVGPTEKVSFIGLDEKELVSVTLEELRAKSYLFNYKQYLPQSAVEVEGFDMVKLDTLLKQKNYPKHPTEYGKESGKFRFYTGAESTKLYTDTPDIDDLVIIVNRTNGSGKSHIFLDSKCSIAGQTITFSCKDDNTTRYVYYYLRSNIKVLEDGYVGANHKNLTIQYVNDMKIPLPSLERQQQIVEAIDGWTNLAQNEEASLKMLEKQMMFQVKEMGRGQARVKLGEIATFTFGYGIKSEDFGESGIPIIKTKNFKDNSVTIISSNPRSNKKYDDKYLIKKGDLLMVVDGACGDSAIWLENENGWLNQHVARLHIDNETTRMYVAFVMKGDLFKEYIQSNIVITTIPHMQRDVAKNFEIPLPPLTEQQTLQSDFDEIRHKHAKIATYKAKAQEAIQRLIPGAT